MPKLELIPSERRALRAAAHALHPVVLIGDNGLTTAVLQEIDRGLSAHELIKIHVADTDRDHRETMLASICDSLSCAAVHHLGRMLIIYRPGQSTQRKDAGMGGPASARSRSGRYVPKKRAAHAHGAAAPTDARNHGHSAKPAPAAGSARPRAATPAAPSAIRRRSGSKGAQAGKTAAQGRGIVRRTGSALTLRAGARRGRTTRS